MANRSTVGDYVALQRGTTYRGSLVGKPGPALLGLGSIQPGGGFREGDYKTYGGECPEKLMLVPGDLFASLKGATKDGKMIGSVARVPPSVSSGRLTQDTVKLIFHEEDQEVANYLYWLLRTPQYRQYCAARATGSAVVALSRDDFLSYPVPPLDASRAHLVRLFEDIEKKSGLNRNMDETLEDMARALFKSWFVNFDPVRAKLEGRSTGFPDNITALFPGSFEDSEIGAIPYGWKVGLFGHVIRLLRNQENPANSPYTVFQHYSIPAFDDGQWPKAELGTEIKSQKFNVPPNSVLVSKLNPEIERVWLIDVSPSDRAICSTEFLVLEPRVPFGRAYIYCLARSFAFRNQIQGLVTGTSKSHQRAQADSVLQLQVVIPPSALLERFDSFCSPLLQRIAVSRRQSRTLAAVRNTLLPKLSSGEFLVPDAERIVGGQV
jgi:type I restriction enzyme, S subunit